MKKLKLIIPFFLVAVFFSYNIWGQTIQTEAKCSIDPPGIYYPGIGTVTGSYVYHISYNLTKDGYLENLHWNAKNWDLVNQDGDKVSIIDSGHDKLGAAWDFFNRPGYYNSSGGYDMIYYSYEDGWLNEFIPDQLPLEGSFVGISCKVMCKGKQYHMGFMMQLHINANGELTAEVIKTK